MYSLTVRKRAKFRNRFNQVPHLTHDTNGKAVNSQLDITNESQEVSTFPAGDHKATINRRTGKHNKHTEITLMIQKRGTAMERSVKYFTGGIKTVSRRQPNRKIQYILTIMNFFVLKSMTVYPNSYVYSCCYTTYNIMSLYMSVRVG